MSNLQTRLRELRKENNLTQFEMARMLREKYNLKTDRVMISKWETGFQTPEIYTITCIADLFDVSIDYLNGKDVFPSQEVLTKHKTASFPILEKYNRLNDIGQNKTEAYIDGLLENPYYIKDKENHIEEAGRKYTNITFEDNNEHIAAFGGIKEDDDVTYTT